jgi:hypothetical protein
MSGTKWPSWWCDPIGEIRYLDCLIVRVNKRANLQMSLSRSTANWRRPLDPYLPPYSSLRLPTYHLYFAPTPSAPSPPSLPLPLPTPPRQLAHITDLTMVDPKWTGTEHDRREMRTLKLNQVVRVSTPNYTIPPFYSNSNHCPSATLVYLQCSALPQPCSPPGKLLPCMSLLCQP